MSSARHRRAMQLTTWALGCQGLLGLAVAGSPFSRGLVDRSPDEHRSAASHGVTVARLDLSLPQQPTSLAQQAAPRPGWSGAATATASPETLRFAPASNDDQFAVQPAWHGPAPRLTSMTRIQELVRNQPRDGVPLARLWQSRGAALNLGVSPRGKPGLYFVKAVP
jgi:hypothetical protein